MRASRDHADLLGARLTAVGNHPITRVMAEARLLWGGVEPFRDQFSYNLIESPEWLHAVGLAVSASAAAYTFELADGATVTRTIVGAPSSSTRPTSPPGRTLSPAPLPAEAGAWRTWLSPDRAPWALQAFDDPFRWRMATSHQALVIQMRRNADAGERKIGEAIAEYRRVIAEARPQHLVLDFRWNGGGDLNTTRAFMQALPTLVPGRIVALTGPLTFSAAISSLGYLKQAAPERATIVGEPVGDRQMFFAEGRPVTLPHSRLIIATATERHDYQSGCRVFTDCHRAVVRYPIAVESLAPDVVAPWTGASYAAGQDPAMTMAEQLLARNRRP